MIILASASPRRQELLRNAAIPFVAQPANIDERQLDGELPRQYAERLAKEKALAVQRDYPESFVLGADTIVVLDGVVFGKPRDLGDAERMLRALSSRQHSVITGVCLAKPVAERKHQRAPHIGENFGSSASQLITFSEMTLVTMSDISEEEIRDYIGTNEPMDKAGGYGIQGIAARWIPRIEGDYSNVVGLPICRVYSMLRMSGVL